MDATTAPEGTGTTRGTTLATLGFLMAAGGPLLLIVASLAFGLDTEDIAFFVIPVVLGILGAVLVRRRSTALRIVAIVLALGVFMTVFWTVFGLTLPASFFDFVPGTLVLPGVLLAIGATIASIRSAKAGRPAGGGERRTATVIVAVLGLLAVASAILTITGRDTVPDALADDAAATLVMEDFEFDAAGYDLQGGDTIVVKNDDPFAHNVTVEALGIDVDLGPYSETLIELPDEAGTYVLYCEPHTSDTDDPSEDDMATELTLG